MANQTSTGNNSPIVSGNNNTVNYNAAPQAEPKLEGARYYLRSIPSPDENSPYAAEITLQFSSELTRFAAIFTFKNPIAHGQPRTQAQFMEGYGDVDMSKLPYPERSYALNLVQCTPPVGPQNSIIITILAKQPIEIVAVERVLH